MTVSTAPVVRLERTIPAAPADVFRAWLDPDIVQRWWAAGTNRVTRAEVDARPGGSHRVWQDDADGNPAGGFDSDIVELIENERLVLRWGFAGQDGGRNPEHDSTLTVTFAPAPGDPGATHLTLTHERLDALHAATPAFAEKVQEGWADALGNLQRVFGG